MRDISRLTRVLAVWTLFGMVGGYTARAQAVGGVPAGVKVFPLREVTRGLKGVAYTVFEGVVPEAMEVEVLGVLKDAIGPGQDMILGRLGGAKATYTGVVAGMSGSPVYIDGRLLGAVSYRIGQFSKEPIAGITPIEQMFEVRDAAGIGAGLGGPGGINPALSRGAGDGAAGGGGGVEMQAMETPLVFSGFSREAVDRFGDRFRALGMTPVAGLGGVDAEAKQPEPLVPGSAVSAVLVRGDLSVAGTCTVTYVDATQLLACGHPLTQYGRVEIPMTKTNVVATLASPLNAFKIVNATETVGAFTEDRASAILGRFGAKARMIPVVVEVVGGEGRDQGPGIRDQGGPGGSGETLVALGQGKQKSRGNGDGKGEKQIPFGDDKQKGKGDNSGNYNGNGKGEKQIPFGDDKQKGKGNNSGNYNGDGRGEKQIPFGDDKQKGKGNNSGNYNGDGKGEKQIPFGDDKQKGKSNNSGNYNGDGRGEKQIPFGDDKQKGKGDNSGNYRGNGDGEKQIPFGDDKQKGNGNGSGESGGGGETRGRTLRFEVLDNRQLTPSTMLVSVYQALQGTNSSAAEISYRLTGEMTVAGVDGKALAPVRMEGEMAQNEFNPAAINAALFVGQRFTQVYQNAVEQPVITGLKLRVEAVPVRRTAVLETARLGKTEARAGETVEVEATVRGYHAEARVVRMRMTVPAGTGAGPLRVMVSDGATLDRLLQPAGGSQHPLGLADMVAQMNREHANDRVYLTVLERSAQAVLPSGTMVGVPLSMANVFEPLKDGQEMRLTGESALEAGSVEVAEAVTGSKVLTLMVR